MTVEPKPRRCRFWRAATAAVVAVATLAAAPPRAAAEVSGYADVSEDAYYAEAVRHLAASGVLDGTDCAEGMFCPQDPILRSTVAVWLTRALNKAPKVDDPLRFSYAGNPNDRYPGWHTFDDVDAASFEAAFIYALARWGVTVGCRFDPAEFCGDQAVTRAQMASFLVRAFELPDAAGAGFADIDTGSVHAKSADRLFAAGITTGCARQPLRYCPNRQLTRAQMAAFIYRGLQQHPVDTSSDGADASEDTNSGGETQPSQQATVQAPRDVEVIHHQGSVAVVWQSPADSLGKVASYWLQWRRHSDNFDEFARQQIQPSGDREDLDRSRSGFLVPVDVHDLHEVRVTAVGRDGSAASTEAPSQFSPQALRQLIVEEVVDRFGGTHRWVALTWAYMDAQPVAVNTAAPDADNAAEVWLQHFYMRPLDRLEATEMIVRSDLVDEMYLSVYVHELAHIYTLVSDLPDEAAPIGVAHLYFQHMINTSDAAADQSCVAAEFYADVAAVVVLAGNAANEATYWQQGSVCAHGHTTPTDEAIEVVQEALAGTTPGWVQDTFSTSSGLDLGRLWDLLASIPDESHRAAVLYQLKDEFGGYCNETLARRAAADQQQGINPWNDGGCDTTLTLIH